MTTFTTWDPEELVSAALSGGNLTVTASAAGGQVRAIDYRTTGKLYFEVAFDASGGSGSVQVGVCGTSAELFNNTHTFSYSGQTGNFAVAGGSSGTGLGALASQTACFAIDIPNKKGWVRRNSGLWNNDAAANPATNTNGLDLTTIAADGLQPFCTQANTGVAIANFGSSAFAFTIPSGFTGWDVSGSTCLYANAGGTGNRTASITATTSLTISGTFSNIINGNTSETTMFFNGSSVGNTMKFDFGAGVSKIIDMWRFYASNNAVEGVWQVAGSPDDITYTNLGGNVTLQCGDTTRTSSYFLANNTTAYRYYRWTLISGATSSSPWIQELEFRIALPGTGAIPAGTHAMGFSMAVSLQTMVSISAPINMGFTQRNRVPNELDLPKNIVAALGLGMAAKLSMEVRLSSVNFALGFNEAVAIGATQVTFSNVAFAMGFVAGNNSPISGGSKYIKTVVNGN